RAIAEAARARTGEPAQVTEFADLPGLGVEGTVAGRRVLVGRARLLAERGLPLTGTLAEALAAADQEGGTAVAIAWDGGEDRNSGDDRDGDNRDGDDRDGEGAAPLVPRGPLARAHAVRPTSAEAISQLIGLGLTPIMVTGDNAAVAHAVADEVGIDEVIAEVLPQEKADVVRRLQEQGKVVAMVGDGVNDAAALAQADLGLSMGTGTDVAIEAGDLTLVRGDLRAAVDAIRLSRRTLATIKGNLFWAFAYNVAAIPLAMAGLLNPMLAGAAMAFSSVFVVSNSLRLRGFTSAGAAR